MKHLYLLHKQWLKECCPLQVTLMCNPQHQLHLKNTMKLKHQHDKQEGEAQSWPKILIPEYKPIEIGAQSLQLIQGFLTLAKYL